MGYEEIVLSHVVRSAKEGGHDNPYPAVIGKAFRVLIRFDLADIFRRSASESSHIATEEERSRR